MDTRKFNKELKKYLNEEFQKDTQMVDLVREVAFDLIKKHESEFVIDLSTKMNDFLKTLCNEMVEEGVLEFGVDKNGKIVYWENEEQG